MAFYAVDNNKLFIQQGLALQRNAAVISNAALLR